MGQRTIRFPDNIEEAIQAEATRTNRKFHWVVVNHCRTIGANRALGTALSETNGAVLGKQAGPAPAPSQEGVRPAAPSQTPDRTDAFRQATTRRT
jgi:hypothetical protein